MKRFNCGDVVPGCETTFVTADEDEMLATVGRHAHDDHGLTEVTDELVAQVRSAMSDL